MKKLFALAVLGTLCFASCAQKEEKREEYKEEHSVNEMRALILLLLMTKVR